MASSPTFFFPTSSAEHKNEPALSPPAEVTPYFTGPNQRGAIHTVLCAILLGIVYVFVLLRFYAKFWIKRNPGLDDCKTPTTAR